MIYPAHFEQKIGFDKIRDLLAARCTTEGAREKVSEISFITDFAVLQETLEITDEMREIVLLETSFPGDGFPDCLSFLKQLAIPSHYLDLAQIGRLQTLLVSLRAVLRFFDEKRDKKYPRLCALAQPVAYYPAIARRIELLIDRTGAIRDNANPELYEICKSKRSKEQTVVRRMQSILRQAQETGLVDADAAFSVRDGRMLIPVSATNKHKIEGLVYDESASGKTVFIEPLEIVALNNAIRELEFARQREILRILCAFSDFLRPYRDDLLTAARFMVHIDFLRAKAQLAIQMQAGKPVVSPEPGMYLLRARHPLLEESLKKENREIVPLSLGLTREKRILLISGPNAGGKTACLKTVGLLQYMLQCGLLIPAAESSEMGMFRSLFIDIGDEQSLEKDLSTYSSHLLNMRECLSFADAESLLLIDEFGSGTEPTAGGAIAEALLEQWEQKGCYGILTTHYSNLKLYATASSSVLNGAMQFDLQQIKPLFKLEIGVPGNSFAFELARQMGLPETIIAAAREKAGTGFVHMERQLKSIARSRHKWEEKLIKIKQTDRNLETITDKYQNELTQIQAFRKQMLQEAKEEARRIVEEANKKVELTIKEIRESQADRERTRTVREELKQFKQSLDAQVQREEDLEIERKMEALRRRQEQRARRKAEAARRKASGSAAGVSQSEVAPDAGDSAKALWAAGAKVKFKDSDLTGEILEIKGDKAKVAVGNLHSWKLLDELEILSANEYRKTHKPLAAPCRLEPEGLFRMADRRLHFSPNLDVRGLRPEEAQNVVNHFLDDAMMLGISDLSILHGKGNGVLREEIRRLLQSYGPLLTFADEHVERGGSGITVVHIL